jgi:hypothetical protein
MQAYLSLLKSSWDAPSLTKTGSDCDAQADNKHAATQDDINRAVKIDASQPNLFENITTPDARGKLSMVVESVGAQASCELPGGLENR